VTELHHHDRAPQRPAGPVAAHDEAQGRGPARFEIQLGHVCNNRCVFCSSGELTERGLARPVPTDAAVAAIQRAARRGARHITFLGGEPTTHRGFFEALQAAADAGFETIVVFTNGVRFPQEGFIERVIAVGPQVEWRISIQGSDEAAHTAVTGREDAFDRILVGLRKLQALGQRVTANLAVNTASAASLPGYVDLVRRYGLRALHVDVIRPDSAGDRSASWMRSIMPPYSALAAPLRAMLEGFEAWDPAFPVTVGNLPFCVLPAWSHVIAHGGDDTVTQSAAAQSLAAGEDDKYGVHAAMRSHPAYCDGCAFRARCAGVFHGYRAIHGDEGLGACSLDDVAAADPSGRDVALFAGHAFEAITAGVAPAWVQEGQPIVDPRGRRYEQRYRRGDRGARLRLKALRRDADAPGVLLRCERFALVLGLEDGPGDPLSAADARTLLTSIATALRGQGHVVVPHKAALRRLMRRFAATRPRAEHTSARPARGSPGTSEAARP
jgi:MoaA/NifB/PqqE/SkfB family radical SAM enzyme